MNGRRIRVHCGVSPEKGETGVALMKHANTLQLTECFRRIESAAVLGDDESARREKRSRAKKGEDAAVLVVVGVRRVEENDVEWSGSGNVFRGEALQAPQRIALENSCAPANAEGIEILLNESGCGRMILDEHNFSGAATERFHADGAGAGEDVEKAAAGDASSQDIEK
jgi:hypothetical protein